MSICIKDQIQNMNIVITNDLTADESALTGESVPSAKATDAVFTDPKTPVADRTNN